MHEKTVLVDVFGSVSSFSQALPEYSEEVESEAGTQAGNGTNSGVQVSCI